MNPRASTVIVYTFDASSGARKLPFSDATNVRTRPEGSAKVIRAPATSSEGSRTPSPFASRYTRPGYTTRNASGRSNVVDPVNDLRSWYAFGPWVAWTSYVPRGSHAMYAPKLLVLVRKRTPAGDRNVTVAALVRFEGAWEYAIPRTSTPSVNRRSRVLVAPRATSTASRATNRSVDTELRPVTEYRPTGRTTE